MTTISTDPARAGSAVWPRDCGVLLVGHGSREAIASEEFFALANLVAQAVRPSAVETCFLEFSPPTIDKGFRALAACGVRRIVVAPVLLFSAGHAQRDIPAEVARTSAKYPQIEVAQAEHLGCHSALVELSAQRCDEALRGHRASFADDTALVLVGRGSYEPSATDEMLQIVVLRQQAAPRTCVRAGFLAMAEPRLEAVLEEVAQAGFRRVIVQPHLLFGGVLVDRTAAIVSDFARRYVNLQWMTAAHLGPSPLVASALVERATRALAPLARK